MNSEHHSSRRSSCSLYLPIQADIPMSISTVPKLFNYQDRDQKCNRKANWTVIKEFTISNPSGNWLLKTAIPPFSPRNLPVIITG